MTAGNVARVLIPSLQEAKQSRFGAANRDVRIRMSARRWLLSFGDHKQRQGNELGEHREYDKCHTRLLIEQSRHNAADQPSHAIARVKQTEGQIAFALRQHTGHHRLEQGVRVAYPMPQNTMPARSAGEPPKNAKGENSEDKKTATSRVGSGDLS